MSRYYRTLIRVFGPVESVLAAYEKFLQAEAEWPSHEFSCKWISLSGSSRDISAFEMRAELSRRAPGIAKIDLSAGEWRNGTGLTFERVLDDEDSESVEIFQGGTLLYQNGRQEAYGNIYELGTPGVEYTYGPHNGDRSALASAMRAAGVTNPFTPL